MLWLPLAGMHPAVDHPPPAPAAPPPPEGPPWTRPGFVLSVRASVDAADLSPGVVFVHHPHEGEPCPYWDNCDGAHMEIVLPNGRLWDVMARASNCDMPGDRTHRCWVLHGSLEDPSTLTVDKAGPTCGAGQGSILSASRRGEFHGFLRSGQLVT